VSGVERVDTARLIGYRIAETETDLHRLRILYQDPEIAHWLGGTRSDDGVDERFAFELAHWRDHGFGAWMFTDRETGAFAGRGAIRHAQVFDGDEIELGYALVTPSWGRGLATEIAAALVVVARDGLGLGELAAWTMTTNTASRRVLEKVGFGYRRAFERLGLPHRYYHLTFDAD
jgi:[ribosomal protein S5]-alanine N-acetyltransferase